VHIELKELGTLSQIIPQHIKSLHSCAVWTIHCITSTYNSISYTSHSYWCIRFIVAVHWLWKVKICLLWQFRTRLDMWGKVWPYTDKTSCETRQIKVHVCLINLCAWNTTTGKHKKNSYALNFPGKICPCVWHEGIQVGWGMVSLTDGEWHLKSQTLYRQGKSAQCQLKRKFGGPQSQSGHFAPAKIQTVDHPAHSPVSAMTILSRHPLTRYSQTVLWIRCKMTDMPLSTKLLWFDML
jgi:hypothetical protein